MQIAGFSWLHAPVVTGHPPGAPQTRPAAAPALGGTPLNEGAGNRTGFGIGTPAIWRRVGGAQEPARPTPPPSIVQIRISRILNDQASWPATADPGAADPPQNALAGTAEARPADGSARVFLPFESRRPTPGEDLGALLIVMAPEGDTAPDSTADPAAPRLPAYEETASLSRSAVFKTLP